MFRGLQEFPGSHSQAVSANEAEVIIGKIVDAHLTSHPQAPVTRSRKSYAVHECRKRLATCGHVNPRRLIALALLLCPGEASVKHEIMLVIMPPAEEVCSGTWCNLVTSCMYYCSDLPTVPCSVARQAAMAAIPHHARQQKIKIMKFVCV